MSTPSTPSSHFVTMIISCSRAGALPHKAWPRYQCNIGKEAGPKSDLPLQWHHHEVRPRLVPLKWLHPFLGDGTAIGGWPLVSLGCHYCTTQLLLDSLHPFSLRQEGVWPWVRTSPRASTRPWEAQGPVLLHGLHWEGLLVVLVVQNQVGCPHTGWRSKSMLGRTPLLECTFLPVHPVEHPQSFWIAWGLGNLPKDISGVSCFWAIVRASVLFTSIFNEEASVPHCAVWSSLVLQQLNHHVELLKVCFVFFTFSALC